MSDCFPMVPLGEVCEFLDRRGVTPKKLGSDFVDSGFRVISAKNIKGRTVNLNVGEQRYVNEETYRKWMTSPLFADDVLLTSEAPLGEPAYLESDREWCLGQRLFCLRSVKACLFGRYLFYAFQSPVIRADMLSRATGATAQGIRQAELRRVAVPLPPLAEQKRIVAILDEAFGAIERAKQIAETNVANARELFDSYLNRVFAEKGEGWEETALEDLVQSESPITYGVVKPGSEGDVAFVRGGDLRDGEVLVSQLRTITSEVSEQYKRTLLKGGELLVCLVGVPGQVGIAPPELAEANIARQVGLVRLRDEIDARFVSYFLLSKPGKEGLGGYTGGSVQQVINLRDLKKVKVPLPTDHSEQVQIGKKIHSLRNHTRRLQGLSKSKFNALDELKQSILQKAFTGQLTAKSPELEAVP